MSLECRPCSVSPLYWLFQVDSSPSWGAICFSSSTGGAYLPDFSALHVFKSRLSDRRRALSRFLLVSETLLKRRFWFCPKLSCAAAGPLPERVVGTAALQLSAMTVGARTPANSLRTPSRDWAWRSGMRLPLDEAVGAAIPVGRESPPLYGMEPDCLGRPDLLPEPDQSLGDLR